MSQNSLPLLAVIFIKEESIKHPFRLRFGAFTLPPRLGKSILSLTACSRAGGNRQTAVIVTRIHTIQHRQTKVLPP